MTTSPGTTGPALIFTSCGETATGIGVPAEILGALMSSRCLVLPFPATGKDAFSRSRRCDRNARRTGEEIEIRRDPESEDDYHDRGDD